jgi:hypothetical protein
MVDEQLPRLPFVKFRVAVRVPSAAEVPTRPWNTYDSVPTTSSATIG